MPKPDSELHDAITLALTEANTIVGRKYRYGALLLAGEDHIPMKSGSNKKPFQRDNIHAEMSVLKGCARPEGKDMLIARLAPSRSSSGKAGGNKAGALSDSDELDDVDDGGVPMVAQRDSSSAAASHGLGGCGSDGGGISGKGKVLNARPCARCEAKMVQRGVRRCYFTLNATTIGVLEYNAEAS